MCERLPYLGGFLHAAWYAFHLERKPQKYHPNTTIGNVTKGIALTGGWVLVRLALGAPRLRTRPWRWVRSPLLRGALWCWWVTLRMFVATGVPMWAMELYKRRERWWSLFDYRRNRRAQPTPAWEQGEDAA
jgi:hypothetical protein